MKLYLCVWELSWCIFYKKAANIFWYGNPSLHLTHLIHAYTHQSSLAATEWSPGGIWGGLGALLRGTSALWEYWWRGKRCYLPSTAGQKLLKASSCTAATVVVLVCLHFNVSMQVWDHFNIFFIFMSDVHMVTDIHSNCSLSCRTCTTSTATSITWTSCLTSGNIS